MPAIVIAGAGPAGLRTASLLAMEGWQVDVIEEHSEVGIPENCSGLLSVSGLNELGIDAESCTVNRIYGAEIFSANGTKLTVERQEPVALVVKRSEFDKMLFKEAVKNGANIEFNSKLIDVRRQHIFFQRKARGEAKKARVVVGADGVLSKAREIAGIQIDKKYFVQSYQERVSGTFDKTKVQVYFGSFAKGLFAWIIPESEGIARAGIATSLGINAREAFEEFKHKYSFEFETIERQSFMIPLGPPVEEPVKDNILLVGDAAFHVKATTGGGIIFGLNAAQKCAEAITKHLKHGSKLSEYKNLLKPINRELKIHWRIRSYLNSLSDDKLDKLFLKLKKAGIEEFLTEHGDMDRPSMFIGKLLKKPRFWSLLPLIFRLR
ncbi:MAG: NAD(P)/FAD-dependent oxidoreductase [Candidatus Diapherotrites archaeon]|nr:NAD(P)/FAD-dependent oxidoreductase [Candidatus Diapherotrites archaeon]